MHPPFSPTRLVPLIRVADWLLRTSHRLRVQDPQELLREVRAGEPVIFVCRHGQLWPVLWAVRGTATTVLVSQSADGELLARALKSWGFPVSRGSSSASGTSAARQALRTLRAGGPVGLAIDGPRGPRGAVHEGALRLARRAAVPVIPLQVSGTGSWVLRKSWDHFEVPLPLGGLCVRVHPRIQVGQGTDGLGHATGRIRAALFESDDPFPSTRAARARVMR